MNSVHQEQRVNKSCFVLLIIQCLVLTSDQMTRSDLEAMSLSYDNSSLREYLTDGFNNHLGQAFTIFCMLQNKNDNSTLFTIKCSKFNGSDMFHESRLANASIFVSLSEGTPHNQRTCACADKTKGNCPVNQIVIPVSEIVALNPSTSLEGFDKIHAIAYVTAGVFANIILVVVIAAILAFCKKKIDNFLIRSTQLYEVPQYGNISSDIQSCSSRTWADTEPTASTDVSTTEDIYRNCGMNSWRNYPESEHSISTRNGSSVANSSFRSIPSPHAKECKPYYVAPLQNNNNLSTEERENKFDNKEYKRVHKYEIPSWGTFTNDVRLMEIVRKNAEKRRNNGHNQAALLRTFQGAQVFHQSSLCTNTKQKIPSELSCEATRTRAQGRKQFRKVMWTDENVNEDVAGISDDIKHSQTISSPFKKPFILSRSFQSLHDITGQTKVCSNPNPMYSEHNASNAHLMSKNGKLGETTFWESESSINRCSTVANANKDIFGANLGNSIWADRGLCGNQLNGSEDRLSFVSSVSEH